jgi:hypothetical protein
MKIEDSAPGKHAKRAEALATVPQAGNHEPEASRKRRLALRPDILFASVGVLAIFFALIWAAALTADTPQVSAAFISGGAVLIVALVGTIVKVTTARQNQITLFSSEIRAIQSGLSKMEMVTFWLMVFDKPGDGTKGWADAPRSSDYFALFHAESGTIVSQDPQIVEAIVRFYTYLKMSRDAAAAVAGWQLQKTPDEGARKRDVQHVVRLLGLAVLWGFIARYAMGQHPDRADADLMKSMAAAMDVVDPGSFARTFEELPHRDALERFFGLQLNQPV